MKEALVRRTRLVLISALMLVSSAVLPAGSFVFPGVEFSSARLDAMGGMHVALADDITTLFSNPAGFRQAGPQLSVSELTMSLSGPVFSIADLMLRVANGESPNTLLSDPKVSSLLTSLYASAGLNGPISFGYVGNGLGFGFFNSSDVTFETEGTLPTVTTTVNENLMFVGGYAFAIPLPPSILSTLDFGVSLKVSAQGSVVSDQAISTLLSTPDISFLTNAPFDLYVGMGVDAGVLYTWNKTLSVGIVGRNIYAPVMKNSYARLTSLGAGVPTVSYGYTPLNLSAGILFSPRLGILERYVTNLKLMLDYSDILDFVTHAATATNPVLHVGIGAEVVVLQILALRAGFNEGYFSAGLGLNLTYFSLNLTMFGSELSTEPGLHPVYNLLVGLEFRY
jgi:hypothetical protein